MPLAKGLDKLLFLLFLFPRPWLAASLPSASLDILPRLSASTLCLDSLASTLSPIAPSAPLAPVHRLPQSPLAQCTACCHRGLAPQASPSDLGPSNILYSEASTSHRSRSATNHRRRSLPLERCLAVIRRPPVVSSLCCFSFSPVAFCWGSHGRLRNPPLLASTTHRCKSPVNPTSAPLPSQPSFISSPLHPAASTPLFPCLAPSVARPSTRTLRPRRSKLLQLTSTRARASFCKRIPPALLSRRSSCPSCPLNLDFGLVAHTLQAFPLPSSPALR
ncbi:hypothetical protein CDD82_5134 [Ophiocordyceps australis]|uniref:Uncharacterized protein n=1 Tax=Ophiocordyceps australis TaxID=1399860 RepID=A0A2C5ZTC4_9HYPO|nr:hypothetical protein CDD82_5134 [Ophiocordyceps australis]